MNRQASYLQLRDVTKSYDGRSDVVEGVSLDIYRGEFLTLLGPSGAGKSTVLLMIAGFESPTAGDIALDSRSLSRVKPHRRNIGMVFQNYALFPHLTVSANVAYPLRMRNRPAEEIRDRVRGVLDLVGLSALGDRRPRELSGGQQQRAALARALVFKPDVLLLDEPLGALDKSLREQMQVELRRIHTTVGITTVYVTHDQAEAMTLSDRIAVLDQGRIAQVGAPLEVYERPATLRVGKFIGDGNFFPATVADITDCRLRIDSLGEWMGPRGSSFSSGAEVHLMVRPENMHLVEGKAPPDMNVVDVTVETSSNYGDSVLVVGMTHGIPVRVRFPGTNMAAVKSGDRLRVGWHRHDAHLIPW